MNSANLKSHGQHFYSKLNTPLKIGVPRVKIISSICLDDEDVVVLVSCKKFEELKRTQVAHFNGEETTCAPESSVTPLV